jgi:Lipocalin-like domain
MKAKFVSALFCIVAVIVWAAVAGAQATPAAPKVQLPNGDTVWDLSGDWDAFFENYGARAHYGFYPTVWRITQTGSVVSAVRAKNNPAYLPGRAGSVSLQGELDKDGFKQVTIVPGGGELFPSKGQISEDGKKIVVDNGESVRVTLTRSGDRTPLVGLWRLREFAREYQATGEREYPMGNLPAGYIHFSPDGRMTVVITGEGRKAPTTDQDRVRLFNTLVAYTGPYRVDGDKWITMVEVSMNPAWVGTEQTRMFEISGDRLQETQPWTARPDNRMARAVITYERVK